MATKRWMLPDGMEEALPPVSWQLEGLRRRLLDQFRAQDYELILPPMVEHLDSLLTGAGSDLERRTFKFADPDTGRLLGIRADMTPQAARIAARRFAEGEITRLCYVGTVLRTEPVSPGGPRSPRQVGCELFGDSALDADFEVLKLMLTTLNVAKIGNVHVDLGHVAIYRAVVDSLKLSPADEAQVFEILQRKSAPDLRDFGRAKGMVEAAASLEALMGLHGDVSVIDRARQRFGAQSDEINQALNVLEGVADRVGRAFPTVPVHLDLAELRGLRYHTGLVFAGFVPGYGREIARGGRYDGVGQEFGRALPATGFSSDLNELLRLGAE